MHPSSWANASGVLLMTEPPLEFLISGQVSVPFVVTTNVADASASKNTKPKFSWLVGSAKAWHAERIATFCFPDANPRKYVWLSMLRDWASCFI